MLRFYGMVLNCLATIKDAHRNGNGKGNEDKDRGGRKEEVSLKASAISRSLNSPSFIIKSQSYFQ